jgi:hypothetical protein
MNTSIFCHGPNASNRGTMGTDLPYTEAFPSPPPPLLALLSCSYHYACQRPRCHESSRVLIEPIRIAKRMGWTSEIASLGNRYVRLLPTEPSLINSSCLGVGSWLDAFGATQGGGIPLVPPAKPAAYQPLYVHYFIRVVKTSFFLFSRFQSNNGL